MANYQTSNKYYREWMFWLGVIATVAYRIIIILNEYSSTAVKVSWYIGTIGFFWYFIHRFRVQKYRESLIKEKRLLEKIKEKKDLNDDDHDALVYIVKSIKSTKAEWNYFAIFILSGLALLYGIFQDFIL